MLRRHSKKLRVEVVYWFEPSAWSYFFPKSRMARLWGSDAMRLQIRNSMLPHLPDNIELAFSGLPLGRRSGKRLLAFQTWLKTRRRAVFILTKHIAHKIAPEELAQLKDSAIAVGLDHADSDPSRINLLNYDFHISASEAGRRGLEAMLDEDYRECGRRPFVDVFYQAHDQRLENVCPRDLDRLSAIYLGLPKNAFIPAALSKDIRIMKVERNEEMERAVQALDSYNFHYAVRPNPEATLRRIYKPFTKGVTAAACRSNILVNRQVEDAIEFLTADYPYLIESNSHKHIEDGFRKAQDEFGGPEWLRGLEIMRDVRERVSGQAQARQFTEIVIRAAGRG